MDVRSKPIMDVPAKPVRSAEPCSPIGDQRTQRDRVRPRPMFDQARSHAAPTAPILDALRPYPFLLRAQAFASSEATHLNAFCSIRRYAGLP